MKNKLYIRLAAIIVAMATGILFISAISFSITTHYHITMYEKQAAGADHNMPQLNSHLEQAILQSVLWTCLGAIVLAICLGLYVARKISAPLIGMKLVAEKMTEGQLDVRTVVHGTDELSELGTSINELAEQLQKMEKIRVTMTEDIAHELRTPLATLKSHMRALEDGIWEPTPERIHSCYEEIERLADLIVELEALNELDSPVFRLARSEVELDPLLQKVTHLMSAAFCEKEVRLTLKAVPDIKLYADRDRLTQIVVNLLSNALKFTPPQGEVTVEAREEKSSVLLTVRDTGAGISPTDLPYLFERFYRGDKSRNRKSGGSGLGLAIVQKLVQAHGGEVWAESSQGAVFYVRLPFS
ncbi:cell wall metabolism sensor histidine kinase WalK [Paenibacillus sp. FJAT-26967]|uniref:sensor histidine kinase n=1 Tax=Paenibacillus sp. FJAT-26967 TaxID=1729690 RepID=UPI0008390144|nr:ATP-binding protein [Paenibacillus sp. FJAT-26967]